MSIKIDISPGQRPAGWDRNVVFFANILALFYGNDSETDVLRQEVGALETYGSRLLPILNLMYEGEDNLLVLHHEPDLTLISYFRNELGLKLPGVKVLPQDIYDSIGDKESELNDSVIEFTKELVEHKADWVDGYVTDLCLNKIAYLTEKKTVSSEEGSREGNNKLKLHQYLEDQKLLTFDTYIAEQSSDVADCCKKLKQKGYSKAVIKAQVGASGIGMMKFNLNGVFKGKLPEYLFYEGSCMVQGWLDESLPGIEYIGSPSVQMFLKDEEVTLFDVTEQILSVDSIHEGNIAPPTFLDKNKNIQYELLEEARTAARWLYEQGYRGTASVDFYLVNRDGRQEVRICEINARVTGATYPALLARHFCPEGAWLMRNVRFTDQMQGERILEALNDSGILFYPNRQEGVLPINFNQNAQGAIVKGQFLFLSPTVEGALQLMNRMSHVAALSGDYDRD